MEQNLVSKFNKKRFLTEEEVKKILISVRHNNDHYLILGLFYSCGLTVNELVNLKINDINLISMSIQIPGGRNLKKRNISIPEELRYSLESKTYGKKTGDFLFTGRKGNIHRRTVQKIFDRVYIKTGILVSAHILRKSIAIHLYCMGWSKFSIQSFLGHSQSQSTLKILRGFPEPKPGNHPINNMHINIV